MAITYPFSAIVGQDEMKLALLIAAVDQKVGGVLVERESHELWWIAAGVQHPHCRGRWVVQQNPDSAGDSAFSAWLTSTLRG